MYQFAELSNAGLRARLKSDTSDCCMGVGKSHYCSFRNSGDLSSSSLTLGSRMLKGLSGQLRFASSYYDGDRGIGMPPKPEGDADDDLLVFWAVILTRSLILSISISSDLFREHWSAFSMGEATSWSLDWALTRLHWMVNLLIRGDMWRCFDKLLLKELRTTLLEWPENRLFLSCRDSTWACWSSSVEKPDCMTSGTMVESSWLVSEGIT